MRMIQVLSYTIFIDHTSCLGGICDIRTVKSVTKSSQFTLDSFGFFFWMIAGLEPVFVIVCHLKQMCVKLQ